MQKDIRAICKDFLQVAFLYAKNKKERKKKWIFQQWEQYWQLWLSHI